MPGTHYAYFELKPQRFHIHRGVKHKNIADGRKGRVGQRLPCTTSTADPDRENNAGAEAASEVRPRPTENQGSSMNLNQAESGKKKDGLTFTDQINKAEAVMALKGVESQWPYESFNNLGECLQIADPKSRVFAKLSMKADKASRIVSHGLGPFFKEKLVVALAKSVGFSLATDAASFKHQGVKKHVDIDVVFWDENQNEVRVEFFDYNAVGHETAAIQVEHITNSLKECHLPLANVIALSHDNPTVMQATSRQLIAKAKEEGSPGMIDLVCFLHPTHTAFQKMVQALKSDIPAFLVALHSFFKQSTARREDRNLVQEKCQQEMEEDFAEEIDQFYLRHVSSRWLEMGKVVKRVLDLWQSTLSYFLVFLTSPTASQANKAALATER